MMRALLRSGYVGALSLALIGCGEEDADAPADLDLIPGCEATSHSPCLITQSACQVRIWHAVRCLRKSEAEGHPSVRFASRDEFANLVAEDRAARQSPDESLQVGLILELLRLIPSANTYVSGVISARTAFPAGVYFREANEIWLIDLDRNALDAVWVNVLLAHEFVHAQQAEEHDYAAAFGGPITTHDASLVARSLIEGEASLYEMLLAPSYLGFVAEEADFDAWETTYLEQADTGLDEPLRFIHAQVTFPYAYGLRLLRSVHDEGGPNAIHDLFYQPPSSLELMLGELDPNLRSEIQRDWSALEPPADYEGYLSTAFGPRLLEAFLRDTQTPEVARDLALAWRGDSLEIYQRANNTTLVAAIWRLRLANPAAAEVVAASPRPAAGLDGSIQSVVSGSDVAIVATTDLDIESWLEVARSELP